MLHPVCRVCAFAPCAVHGRWQTSLRLAFPPPAGFYGVSVTNNKGVVIMEFAEGRDLQSALQVRAAGSSQRLFSWQRRGRRVAFELAKVRQACML